MIAKIDDGQIEAAPGLLKDSSLTCDLRGAFSMKTRHASAFAGDDNFDRSLPK